MKIPTLKEKNFLQPMRERQDPGQFTCTKQNFHTLHQKLNAISAKLAWICY